MPGHEFEKNVQQRLDELKLRPSETVWKSVEKNIREEKRRRRMIPWLPILFLFLATSGYLIYKQGYISSATGVAKDNTEQNNTVKTLPERNQENNQIDPDNKKDENKVPQQSFKKDMNDELVANNKTDQIPEAKSTLNISKKVGRRATPNAIPATQLKNETAVQAVPPQENKIDLATNQNNVNQIEEEIGYSAPIYILTKGTSPVVTISIPDVHNKSLETPEVDLNSLPKPNDNSKYKSSKWQWGLDFSIGRSSANSELNLFGGSAMMDAGGSVGGNPLPGAGSPSALEPGLYWAAGGFIQRNFSNSFALSTGLKYAQYSTRILTGTRVDSSRAFYNAGNFSVVNNYYRNGKANQYTNRYHFLEIPLTAHIRVTKSNTFPVYANVGLSIGWMLGTNSLNYDGISGAYYYDDDLYNKTQFGLHGGFTVGILNKSKYPIRIGPSFNYKFSGLMENGLSNKHLATFGIDFRVLLKK